MHKDNVISGELKNTGDPKYTKWLYLISKINDYLRSMGIFTSYFISYEEQGLVHYTK